MHAEEQRLNLIYMVFACTLPQSLQTPDIKLEVVAFYFAFEICVHVSSDEK